MNFRFGRIPHLRDGRATVSDWCTAIQEAPENTNPVARWVEAVQPWMPGGRDANDPMQNEVDPTDWPARAKGSRLPYEPAAWNTS